MKTKSTLSPGATLALWAGLCFAAALYGNYRGFGGKRFSIALATFAALLGVQMLFAAHGVAERAAGWAQKASWRGLAAVVPPLLFVFYGWGTGTLRLQGLVLYSMTLLPLLVAAALEPPRDRRLRDIQTYGTLLVLWLVVEFRAWFPFFPYPGSVGGTLFILFGVMHGAWIFLLLRPMEGTGYALDWSRGHGWQIAVNFALIALLVIPLGQAIGFLRFDPSLEQLRLLPLTAAGIFLFNAWPEEFFFRGLLQNKLARTLRNEDLGWVAASVLFGLAHLNNGRFPNWRYAVLATVAGLFYGRTWRRTGSVFAAAVVHTAVNAAWRALFRTL